MDTFSFKTLNEAKKYLETLGFKEYPRNTFSPAGVTAFFQKKFLNKNNSVKYFIDANIWDWSMNDKVPYNYSIEFYGQFYKAGTHEAVNMTFIAWSYEEIVEWLDSLFDNGLIEDYEYDFKEE